MNYPKFKTFQILVPMLKAYNIRHIVISPGSRMREFILAVEEDPFFTTYDVTDERSASYFALGLSQELNEPVVITCTSSTATTNYLPGVTEAYYQNVPIVVLTGDRDNSSQSVDFSNKSDYEYVFDGGITEPSKTSGDVDEKSALNLLKMRQEVLNTEKKVEKPTIIVIPESLYFKKEE